MTSPTLSQLAQHYPASSIRRVFEAARSIPEAVQLTLGEPDFDTPEWICAEASSSLARHETHYAPNAGIAELREAVARRYQRRHPKSGVTADGVMIGFGGMEALFLALATVVSPGDEVIVPDPAYPNYLGQLAILGASAVRVPVHAQTLRLDPERVIASMSGRVRAVILNSPSNPLGVVLDRDAVDRIVVAAAERGIWVISDEVYDAITYDEVPFASAIDAPTRANVIVVNSLSKSYAMTGWRVGYAVGPAAAIGQMPKLQEGIASGLPPFVQAAGVAALDRGDAFVESMRAEYARRRDLLLPLLREIPGLRVPETTGAFYSFIDITGTGVQDDEEFCLQLLSQQGLALVPGSAFGLTGAGRVRLSFAAHEQTLREGARRLRAYVEGLG